MDASHEPKGSAAVHHGPELEQQHTHKRYTSLWKRAGPTLASALGVELQGSDPVPPEDQTDRRYIKLCTLWFSMNFNLISVSTGMSGTLGFGLSLRDSALIILFFGCLTALFPAYFSTWGSKFGMRQMVHARYAFGIYAVIVPMLLNMATLTGYTILGSILGGQALSAVNPGNLSINVGIVVIGVIALVLMVCGYRILHRFDLFAWLPSLVAILGAVGCGGKYLHMQVEAEPATPAQVLTFVANISGFYIPWAAIASDFSTYFDPRSNSLAISTPAYLGLVSSSIPLMILGAAIGGALPNIPAWEQGYAQSSVGGVMAAMLSPVGGFGKFLLVLLALSLLANVAGSVYALALNLQAILHSMRLRIPRAVCTFVLMVIIIPVTIGVAEADFLASLHNFLGVISYWSACFVAVMLLEHFVIRKGRVENYDLEAWNKTSRLPSGAAALGASVLSFGLVIPGMNQLWFVGPLAKTSGDIGVEMAFFVTGVLYVPLRLLEIRVLGWV